MLKQRTSNIEKKKTVIIVLIILCQKNEEEIKELNDDLKKFMLSKENNKLYY